MNIEKIWLAAIKANDGKVFTGKNHSDCILTAIKINCLAEHFSQDKQGFVTTANRYVNRKEAAQIAYEAGQIKSPQDILISEDLAELEQPEPDKFIKEIYEALTNGVGEKPYYRKEDNQFNIYVADDQLFCIVPFVEGLEGDYAEYIAKAICEAGWIIDRLNAERRTLNAELKRQAERIEELENLLREKIAIAKVSADNENYMIPITIKEAEQALKG